MEEWLPRLLGELQDSNKARRGAAFVRLHKRVASSGDAATPLLLSRDGAFAVTRACLRACEDASERAREAAAATLLLVVAQQDATVLDWVLPVLYTRLGQASQVAEPCEEIRLLLLRVAARCVTAFPHDIGPRNYTSYYDAMLQRCLGDVYAEVQRTACEVVVQLCNADPQGVREVALPLTRVLQRSCLLHKHSKVRTDAAHALAALIAHGAAAALADTYEHLTTCKDVFDAAAAAAAEQHKGSGHSSATRSMPGLLYVLCNDHSAEVRLAVLAVLSCALLDIAERLEQHRRYLPHVLLLATDTFASVQTAACTLLQRLGTLYELDHADNRADLQHRHVTVKDVAWYADDDYPTLQLSTFVDDKDAAGVHTRGAADDDDDAHTTTTPSRLPQHFALLQSRPPLGQRLVVADAARGCLDGLLADVTAMDWVIVHSTNNRRVVALRVLWTLFYHCERAVVQYVERVLAALYKAVRDDDDAVRGEARRCMQMLANFVTPDQYLPMVIAKQTSSQQGDEQQTQSSVCASAVHVDPAKAASVLTAQVADDDTDSNKRSGTAAVAVAEEDEDVVVRRVSGKRTTLVRCVDANGGNETAPTAASCSSSANDAATAATAAAADTAAAAVAVTSAPTTRLPTLFSTAATSVKCGLLVALGYFVSGSQALLTPTHAAHIAHALTSSDVAGDGASDELLLCLIDAVAVVAGVFAARGFIATPAQPLPAHVRNDAQQRTLDSMFCYTLLCLTGSEHGVAVRQRAQRGLATLSRLVTHTDDGIYALHARRLLVRYGASMPVCAFATLLSHASHANNSGKHSDDNNDDNNKSDGSAAALPSRLLTDLFVRRLSHIDLSVRVTDELRFFAVLEQLLWSGGGAVCFAADELEELLRLVVLPSAVFRAGNAAHLFRKVAVNCLCALVRRGYRRVWLRAALAAATTTDEVAAGTAVVTSETGLLTRVLQCWCSAADSDDAEVRLACMTVFADVCTLPMASGVAHEVVQLLLLRLDDASNLIRLRSVTGLAVVLTHRAQHDKDNNDDVAAPPLLAEVQAQLVPLVRKLLIYLDDDDDEETEASRSSNNNSNGNNRNGSEDNSDNKQKPKSTRSGDGVSNTVHDARVAIVRCLCALGTQSPHIVLDLVRTAAGKHREPRFCHEVCAYVEQHCCKQ